MSERWKAYKAEFVWHGDHPDCEGKVRAEIEHDLCDLRAVDLVFHECWLDGDPDGPTVLLWGLKGDKRLHCEFIGRNSHSLPSSSPGAATPADRAPPTSAGTNFDEAR